MGIAIKNLDYKYSNDVQVLFDINLDIQDGEWISIVGHNGSGKSTLTKILCTLYTHKQGQIMIDGIELCEENLIAIRKLFGVVFQNPDNQFVGTTVFDDVAFGLQNLGLDKDEIYYRVDKYLEIVGMKNFKHREPHTLSGGQKQRVAIAATLALEPKYLIFDEATSMLDPIGREEVLELIKYISSTKESTIIVITHDLEEAILSDRIVALNKGKIVYDDVPSEIVNHVELFNEVGVLVPFGVKLAGDLIKRGVNLELTIDESELINKLCQ